MSISDTLRALADEAEADESSHRRVIETLAEQIDALIRENSRSATVASEYRRGLIRAAEIVEATARDNGWLVRDGYAGKFAAAIRKAVVTEKDASAIMNAFPMPASSERGGGDHKYLVNRIRKAFEA